MQRHVSLHRNHCIAVEWALTFALHFARAIFTAFDTSRYGYTLIQRAFAVMNWNGNYWGKCNGRYSEKAKKKEMRAMIESIEDIDFLPVCHCGREHWSIVPLSIPYTMLRSLSQLTSLSLSYHVTRMRFTQLTLINKFLEQVFLNLARSKNWERERDYGTSLTLF